MNNEYALSVKAIEDAARRFNDLAVASTRPKFSWSTTTLWMIDQLSNALHDALDQIPRSSRVLQCDVVAYGLQVCNGRFCPDYLSHLAKRFSACAWVKVRPSATAISPRAMPSRTVMRSNWS